MNNVECKIVLYTYEVEDGIQKICHENDEKVYSTISNEEMKRSGM